jgi:preprotein translocase subunit Sec63
VFDAYHTPRHFHAQWRAAWETLTRYATFQSSAWPSTSLHFVTRAGVRMRDERTTNYYAVLELSPTATEAEIKRAWHEHMQVWHPDRFVHSPALHRKAEARTQLINQAYQTLSDPVARTR